MLTTIYQGHMDDCSVYVLTTLMIKLIMTVQCTH